MKLSSPSESCVGVCTVRLVCGVLWRVAGLEESGEGLLLFYMYTMFTETQDGPRVTQQPQSFCLIPYQPGSAVAVMAAGLLPSL